MKKTNTKLQLKTSTIRILQDRELAEVNGGRATLGCSELATACSHPPNHPPTSGHHGN
jgi:hypothetical protein